MTVQPSQTTSIKILSSRWDGLNPNLIARLYPVERSDSGDGWVQSFGSRTVSTAENFNISDAFEVWAPITDGTQEMSLNWVSPFEGAGAESKVPTLSAMLQSGQLTPDMAGILNRMSPGSTVAGNVVKLLRDATGRTGITKLNSTQVFSGMPPVKFSFTAHFRALIDPQSEVRDPNKTTEHNKQHRFTGAGSGIGALIGGGVGTLLGGPVGTLIGGMIGDKLGEIVGGWLATVDWGKVGALKDDWKAVRYRKALLNYEDRRRCMGLDSERCESVPERQVRH
ncbi:hypothetical protein [Paraburkholderia graminis]